MNRIEKLAPSTKIAIIIVFFLLLLFMSIYSYLTATSNIAIQKVNSYFTGESESEIISEEEIPFSRTTIQDETLADGHEEIRQEGENGIKRITIKVTKDKDGNIINRKTVSEEVVKEPTPEIIAIGTKKESNSASSGEGYSRQGTSTQSPSTGNKNGSSNTSPSNNASGSNGDNSNWHAYNLNSMVSQCEKSIINKFGYGYYRKPTYARMGDTGRYILSGFAYRGPDTSYGFMNVGCSYESKLIDNTTYYNANTISVYDFWPGHIYTENDIK